MNRRQFKANGLTLNCLDYGGEGKPPLLMVHGGSAHAHWWDFVAPHFSGRFHALALDMRGHGESEWAPQWAYGTRHYVADLENLIDTWGLGAPVLVGHSMGGHTVLAYATRHPEKLRAMAAIDSPTGYSKMAVDFLRGVAARPSRRFASLEEAVEKFSMLPRETLAKKDILDHVARHTFKQDQDGAWIHKMDRRTMIRDPIDLWHELANITCPALIVKVVRSPVLDREIARKVVAMMPRGRLAEIDDSYHHVTFDNPAALVAALEDFLRDLK